MTFATTSWSSQPRSGHRLTRSSDRIKRIRLRPVAAGSPLGSVELDDDLLALRQVTRQAGAVPTGPLDRPGPQHGVLVGELHQLGIAIRGGFDGDLAEYPAGGSINHGRGVGMDVGVDADDDIDHLA